MISVVERCSLLEAVQEIFSAAPPQFLLVRNKIHRTWHVSNIHYFTIIDTPKKRDFLFRTCNGPFLGQSSPMRELFVDE